MASKSLPQSLRETRAVFEISGVPLTTNEVADEIEQGRRTTYARLERLVEENELETKKVGSSGRVWWRPQENEGGTFVGSTDTSQTQDQLRALIDAVEEYAIFALDVNGEIRTWNPGAERIKGYEQTEIIGRHFSTFYTEEDRAGGIPENNLRVAAADGFVEDEGWRVRGDGSRFWANVTITAIRDDSGQLEGFAKVTRDLTERREREQKLQRLSARLERQLENVEHELDEVLDRISHGFYSLDEELKFGFINDYAKELLGLDESSVGVEIGEEVVMTAAFENALHDALATQRPIELEDYYDVIDEWYYNAIYPSESGLSVYFQKITEKKEREQELERYETIIETVEDGIYALDTHQHFTLINEGYAEMVGYPREELLGSHISVVVDDEAVELSKQLRERMLTDEIDGGVAQVGVPTATGETIPTETAFAPLWSDDGVLNGTVGIVRDITERVEREERLETQHRMQSGIAELGQQALRSKDLDVLMATASELVADTLDNDFCKVLDLDEDAEELLLRQGVGWDDGIIGDATVSSVESDSQAAYTLANKEPVVVKNLNVEPRISGPDLLTNHDIVSGISVIIGPYEDPWGILGTHDTEAKEFTELEVNFVQSVAHVLATAIDRQQNEQTLRERNESLVALNALNTVSREITESVIAQSTREEIEQTLCESLAATDAYEFAWVANANSTDETLRTRAHAGTDGYHEEITVSVDRDDPRSHGPGGKAYHLQETQVVRDVFSDPSFEPWREAAADYGFSSAAAVPIVHEDMPYGVLGIYADRSEAFASEEREVVSHLGEIVGHAIASTERERAMMSDELVELDVQVPNLFASLGIEDEPTGTITVTGVVPIGNDRFLMYGNATADGFETLAELVETVPLFDDLSRLDEGEVITFEMKLKEPPITSRVTAMGGYIDELVIDDGDARAAIHLAPRSIVRGLLDTIENVYPQMNLISRKQINRSEPVSPDSRRQLLGDLTERQRVVLDASYHSGYFEWPRRTSGEEVADSLDISPATYSQHLRKAQKQMLDSIYESDAVRA